MYLWWIIAVSTIAKRSNVWLKMIIVSFHYDVAILLFFVTILQAHLSLTYSPDYNPIEQAFSSIKAYLRRHGHDSPLLSITRACQNITLDKAEEYFRAFGYIVQYCIVFCHVVRMSSVQCIDHHSLWLSWFIDYPCMIMTVTWTWMWHQQHSFKLQWVWNYLLRPTHLPEVIGITTIWVSGLIYGIALWNWKPLLECLTPIEKSALHDLYHHPGHHSASAVDQRSNSHLHCDIASQMPQLMLICQVMRPKGWGWAITLLSLHFKSVPPGATFLEANYITGRNTKVRVKFVTEVKHNISALQVQHGVITHCAHQDWPRW